MVELPRDSHFVLQRLEFILLVLVALQLPDELYRVELPVLVAAGEVDLAEAPDRQAVVDLVLQRLGPIRPHHEGHEKLGLLDAALGEAEAVVKVDVAVDRLEADHALHDLLDLLPRHLRLLRQIGV